MTSSSTTNIADIFSPNALPPDVDGALGFTEPARLLDYVTRNWRDDFVTEDITTRNALEPFLKRPFVLLVSVDAPALARFNRYNKRTEKCLIPPVSASKFTFFSDTFHVFGSRSNSIDGHGESSESEISSPTTATTRHQPKSMTLEEFITDDDRVCYGADSDHVTSAYLFASHHLCHVNVLNAFPTIDALHEYLDAVNLLNVDRLRPGWDSYFMAGHYFLPCCSLLTVMAQKLASLASHRSNCMKRRVGAILVKNHTIIATGFVFNFFE